MHAHPDDETIVTGGTIALLARQGDPLAVLTCTRGEAGEVIPPDLAHLVGHGDALAEHREGELAAAMRVLGVVDHRFLGAADARIAGRPPRRYRDSGMTWGPDGAAPAPDIPSDALCAAELGEIAADIATVIATTGAQSVVSYDERGGYGHPDHVVTQLAARRAADVMGVPYYAIQPAAFDPAAASAVDVSAVLPVKTEALRAHRSQLTVDGDRIVMPGGQVEAIGAVEAFQLVEPAGAVGGRPDAPVALRGTDRDLPTEPKEWRERSVAVRAAALVSALVGGAVVGAIGTVGFQARLDLGDIRLPIGLVLALLVIAALMTGLRLVWRTRLVAAAAAVGLLGMIALLSTESPGGSVLVPDESFSYWWVYGPPLIVLVALAWPNLTQTPRVRIVDASDTKGTRAP